MPCSSVVINLKLRLLLLLLLILILSHLLLLNLLLIVGGAKESSLSTPEALTELTRLQMLSSKTITLKAPTIP